MKKSQNCSLEEIGAAIGIDGPMYNTFLNMQRVTKQSPCSQSSVQFNEVNAFMTDEVSRFLNPRARIKANQL